MFHKVSMITEDALKDSKEVHFLKLRLGLPPKALTTSSIEGEFASF